MIATLKHGSLVVLSACCLEMQLAARISHSFQQQQQQLEQKVLAQRRSPVQLHHFVATVSR